MTKKFWKTTKFRTLQSEWEKKLKDSGFIDIEHESGRLKQGASNSYRTQVNVVIESKLRYYEVLGHAYHHETFKDEVEKLIIGRRSVGIKIKDICQELRDMGERCHRNTVRLILRHYEGRWGISKKR